MTENREKQQEEKSIRFFKKKKWFCIFLFFIIVLGGSWFSILYYLKREINEQIDLIITSERERGNIWTCNNREINGWGHSLTLKCPSFSVSLPQGKLSTRQVLIHVNVINPYKVNAVLYGPVRFISGDEEIHLTAQSITLMASVKNGNPQEGMLTIQDLKFDSLPQQLQSLIPSFAKYINLHFQSDNTLSNDSLLLDMKINQADWILGNILIKGAGLVNFSLKTHISRFEDLRRGIEGLGIESWRDKGGEVLIDTVSFQFQNKAALRAKGNIQLDPYKLPQGEITVTTQNINTLALLRLSPTLSSIDTNKLEEQIQTTFPDKQEKKLVFSIAEGIVKLGKLQIFHIPR